MTLIKGNILINLQSMNEKEWKEFKEILRKQHQKVTTSKAAARNLLKSLGLLTASGNLKKSVRSSSNVPR
jgi:hypothetical protein